MDQNALLLLAIAAGGFWWWKNHGSPPATPPPGDGATGSEAVTAAKKRLYAFLNSNYHLPASVDPKNLAAAGIDPSTNTAVQADLLPTDPAFPAGTNILVYTSALPQLNAMIISAGGHPLSNVITPPPPPPPAPTAEQIATAKAAMDGFLAPLAAAPAGYSSGDSFNGIAIIRGRKIVPNMIYQQWQMLYAALQQLGVVGYGV